MSSSDNRPGRAGLRQPAILSWLHLLRISRRTLQKANEQLASWGLNNAQFDVITNIGVSEGISQQALAQRLLVTQGNVTQLLATLEAAGLIRRVVEGRRKRLYLTDKGQRLFDEVVPAHEQFIADQLALLTPDENHQLLRLLAKLNQAQRRKAKTDQLP